MKIKCMNKNKSKIKLKKKIVEEKYKMTRKEVEKWVQIDEK